jgi:ATP-dependent DNA helicase RecQ
MDSTAITTIDHDLSLDRMRSLLQEKFGYPDFRGGQESVLTALAHSDVLAVMPTGSGKSMCYVLPALITGRTLVVSPLIALMQDQVESLTASGVHAAFINSTLSRDEQNQNYLDFIHERVNLLFVAPERFANRRFVEGLRTAGIRLLAIDEAHCMSQWGHDFRPDYLRLGAIRDRLGAPRTLALTATADPKVQADIARNLGLDQTATAVVTSVDRPNIEFRVVSISWADEGVKWLLNYLCGKRDATGIVYARTRQSVDDTVALLQGAGLSVAGYHAGMLNEERANVQRRFMLDEISIVVATNAFGMGVDKPDVRFVVHMNMPGRVEAYYQEAGRAGRDGEPAQCTLLFHPDDESSQQFFIDRAHPSDEIVRSIWFQMTSGMTPTTKLGNVADQDGYASAFNALRASGLIDENRALVSTDPTAAIDTEPIRAHQRHVEERLMRMIGYAKSADCRRKMILNYFGEEAPDRCGSCDNCLRSAEVNARPDAQPTVPWIRPTRLSGTERSSSRPLRAIPTAAGGLSEQELYAKLAEWRLNRARVDGVAAYAVCSPKTLREIAMAQPQDYESLASVWGFGASRVDRYGADILAIVNAALR